MKMIAYSQCERGRALRIASGIIALIILILAHAAQADDSVRFTANNNTYIQGGPVIFTIINNGTDTIQLPSPAPWWVEKAKTAEMVFAPFVISVITPLESGKSISEAWDQKDNEGKQVSPGIYRGVINYFSNDFTSKNNDSTQEFEILSAPTYSGSISGIKFNDLNGNGTRDLGEPGLANWTIVLTRPDGSNETAITNLDGTYIFSNLSAGKYTVGEVQQGFWKQTAPSTGTYNVTITSSEEDVTGKDFGNFHHHHHRHHIQNSAVSQDSRLTIPTTG
jgi:hypothetical protein